MKPLLAFLALVLLETSSQAAIINSGHTSVWRDPARSGEGFTLEVLNETTASLAWFTFDEEGDPRWAYAVGTIVRGEDERIEFADVFRSTGGVFGPAYDPASVTTERVGSATLRFGDCDHGTFSFDAFGQAMVIDVQRLTRTMASGCAPIHGVPGEVIQPYAGQSGIWRDVSRFGQGMQLQWIASNAAVLGWYTFDAEGNAYWLTGLGAPVGEPSSNGHSRIVFETLYAPRGARFGAAFDPDDVELVDWGSAELELTCDRGVLRFESNVPSFGSGERQVQLLTRSVPAACPWVKPKIQDLYDIEYTELPIPGPDTSSGQLRVYAIQPRSIGDDGTVIAVEPLGGNGGDRVLRLSPGATEWEELAPGDFGSLAFIAPDSRSLFSTAKAAPPGVPAPALIWTEPTGWLPLPQAFGYERENLYGLSQNGLNAVGTGYLPDDIRSFPWKWESTAGQAQLPVSDDIPSGFALGISNDGNTIVGSTIRNVGGFAAPVAIQWRNGQPPERMFDGSGNALGTARTCNTDCSLIFGFGWSLLNSDPSQPESAQSWFWRGPGQVRYLGLLDDVVPGTVIGVNDVSSDGSLAVGAYSTTISAPVVEAEAWIWTQNTGIVSMRPLLQELELSEKWARRSTLSTTSDGMQILLGGWIDSPIPGEPIRYRAAILRLAPKAASAPVGSGK
jgi:hypothetical protein